MRQTLDHTMQEKAVEENQQGEDNISLYQNHGYFQNNQQLHNSIDMASSSCSPIFSVDSYNQPQPNFLSPKVPVSTLFSPSFMNPYDTSFDFVSEQLHDMQKSYFTPNFDIQENQLLQSNNNNNRAVVNAFSPSDLQSFEFVNTEYSQFVSMANVLKPLEKLPQVNKEATIFQRRMANGAQGDKGKMPMEESSRMSDESGMNSVDGSGLVYNLTEMSRDDQNENLEGNSEYVGNYMGMVIGDNHKGKRKGPPAKNLMAERRRRKKLNDRLYTLRSIVPNISKMDRASILSDAVEYVKMLLQRIDELRKELEATPAGNSRLDQLITTPFIRELEHSPSKLPSSQVNQGTRVEVRAKEGMAVNIHMYSALRPGLLLATMRALENNIGLDVQQAVISCLNGFAMDVFHAEQPKESPCIPPEQIRAILLDTVWCPSSDAT